MIDKYVEILKSKKCSRKDFWVYCGIMWLVFILIFVIGIIFSKYPYGFNYDFYLKFFGIVVLALAAVCFLLQIRRLRDANLSPWILSLYLLGILGKPFVLIVSLIIFAILCLPSQNQEIPTTNLKKDIE